MLNALWAFMMLTWLGWAAVHGTLGAVTEGMLAAAGDAVSLGITMLGGDGVLGREFWRSDGGRG